MPIEYIDSYKNENERFKAAFEFLEEMFPLFPNDANFEVHNLIHKLGKVNSQTRAMIECQEQIKAILVKYGYAEQVGRSSFHQLTEKGRTAKAAGGHKAYEQYLEEKTKKDAEKEQLQYELLKKDLQKANLEIEDLVSKVSDYADNKWKTNASFTISVITIILLVLTTTQQLMCNKPG